MKRLLPGVLAAALFLAPPAWGGGSATKGREIAVEHCSRCHVVPDYNPMGGIGSTPSFKGLTRIADYEERFRTFFARPPHPVFVRVPGVDKPRQDLPDFLATFTMTEGDIADILAYARSIEGK